MREEKWEVIFCRPAGITPTNCEVKILAELCHVKEGKAYNPFYLICLQGTALCVLI